MKTLKIALENELATLVKVTTKMTKLVINNNILKNLIDAYTILIAKYSIFINNNELQGDLITSAIAERDRLISLYK